MTTDRQKEKAQIKYLSSSLIIRFTDIPSWQIKYITN